MSCGWPEIFNFRFFKTRSTSCAARIHTFAFIPFMEFDVVFFANVFKIFHACFQGRWFLLGYPFLCFLANLFFSLKCLFFWLIFIVCFGEQQLFFFSDIGGRCGHFNGCVWIASRFLRRILSVTSSPSFDWKSAAVLTESMMCAILKLNCNTVLLVLLSF